MENNIFSIIPYDIWTYIFDLMNSSEKSNIIQISRYVYNNLTFYCHSLKFKNSIQDSFLSSHLLYYPYLKKLNLYYCRHITDIGISYITFLINLNQLTITYALGVTD